MGQAVQAALSQCRKETGRPWLSLALWLGHCSDYEPHPPRTSVSSLKARLMSCLFKLARVGHGVCTAHFWTVLAWNHVAEDRLLGAAPVRVSSTLWLNFSVCVIINFMHILHWATGYPDTWSSLFWVLLYGCFWDEINIYIRLSKTDCVP